MNKIKKLIRAIGLILKRPYLLNKLLDDESVWILQVKKQWQLESLPELKFNELSDLKEWTVKPFSFMEGGSLSTDLALLKILASKFESCRYFEIGTWRGESVANVAEVASECVTLNLPGQTMLDDGRTPGYVNQHAMFSHGLPNIVHLEGDSATFDYEALVKKFDLVFIDGDHHYKSIKRDTQNVFRHLVHENSIVVWHDYAWQPGNVRYETLAAILDGIPEEKSGNLFAVRNTLCAIYHPGITKGHEASVIAKKDEAFEINLRLPLK